MQSLNFNETYVEIFPIAFHRRILEYKVDRPIKYLNIKLFLSFFDNWNCCQSICTYLDLFGNSSIN